MLFGAISFRIHSYAAIYNSYKEERDEEAVDSVYWVSLLVVELGSLSCEFEETPIFLLVHSPFFLYHKFLWLTTKLS